MAVDKKKEEEIQRKNYDPVSPIQPTSTPQTTQPAQPAVRSVYDNLMAKRNEASAKEDIAKKNWRKAYEETGNVMAGFIPKPKDNTYEEKRLRRAAIAQALGELVGTIGQGIVSTGRGGEGYVTAPLGMYNNTMAQLQKLKEQGIADEKEYANLMANLRMQNTNRDLAMRQKEYEEAATERQAYDKMLLGYDQRLREKEMDAEKAQKEREFRASENEKNRENRINAARISAENRGNKEVSPTKDLTEEENRILYTMLPKERFVKTIDNEGRERIVTQPYSKYPDEQLRAYASVAKVLKKAGATEKFVADLADLLQAKGKDWGVVATALNNEYSLDEIINIVRRLPDVVNPNYNINSTGNGAK